VGKGKTVEERKRRKKEEGLKIRIEKSENGSVWSDGKKERATQWKGNEEAWNRWEKTKRDKEIGKRTKRKQNKIDMEIRKMRRGD
jgi:hypothetical protein